jgi:hypothetical protein
MPCSFDMSSVAESFFALTAAATSSLDTSPM